MDCPQIGGRWDIVQVNGDELNGVLVLEQDGPRISGRVEWRDHADGSIIGALIGRAVSLSVFYRNGSVAHYAAELNADGAGIEQGVVASSTRVHATWTASLVT